MIFTASNFPNAWTPLVCFFCLLTHIIVYVSCFIAMVCRWVGDSTLPPMNGHHDTNHTHIKTILSYTTQLLREHGEHLFDFHFHLFIQQVVRKMWLAKKKNRIDFICTMFHDNRDLFERIFTLVIGIDRFVVCKTN